MTRPLIHFPRRAFVQWAPAFLAAVAAVGSANAVVISHDGAARSAIVVAPDSSAAERHAATELSMFLRQVVGAEFQVLQEPGVVEGRILVGAKAALAADPEFSVDGLGDEGIVIRTIGKDLILAGGEPRGTLYAVYTFLEDFVGCRWWTPAESTIPSKPSLAFADIDVRYVPRIEYRDTDSPEASDPDYSVRNKYNGHNHRLFIDDGFRNVVQDTARGGRKYAYVRSDKWHSHGMWTLIPPELYFDDHPEWYSLIDGKRTCELWRSSLCLTNEDMRRQMVNNALLALNWNPQATMLSVEQVDDSGGEAYCHCDKCLAVQEQEGTPSGPMIRFVNSVAADIEKVFPNAVITTLAYHYSRKPPRLTKPRENVIVRLCDIECSFSKPLSDERNAGFRDDLKGWSSITDRLYVWDYVCNFAYPLLPHPNLRVLGPNVRFLADHKVKGVFAEAFPERGMEMVELRNWVLAKLYWNPDLDGAKLVDEFVRGYYGPAGEHVMSYIDTIHDAVESSRDNLTIWSGPGSAFLSLDTLDSAWRSLSSAGAAASGDAAIGRRVRGLQMSVLYAFLLRWDELRKQAFEAGRKWPIDDSFERAYGSFQRCAVERGVNLDTLPMTPEMKACRARAGGEQ